MNFLKTLRNCAKNNCALPEYKQKIRPCEHDAHRARVWGVDPPQPRWLSILSSLELVQKTLIKNHFAMHP